MEDQHGSLMFRAAGACLRQASLLRQEVFEALAALQLDQGADCIAVCERLRSNLPALAKDPDVRHRDLRQELEGACSVKDDGLREQLVSALIDGQLGIELATLCERAGTDAAADLLEGEVSDGNILALCLPRREEASSVLPADKAVQVKNAIAAALETMQSGDEGARNSFIVFFPRFTAPSAALVQVLLQACRLHAVQPPLDLVIEAISALIRDSGDQVAVGQSILLSALSNALSNPFLGMAFDIMPAGRPFIAEVTTLASTTADTLWLPFDGREEESEARAGALQAARSCVAQFRGILNTGSAQTDAPSFPSALLALLALPGVPRAAASLDLATPPEELFANGGVAALLWAYECSLRRPVQDAVPKLADAAAADEPRLGSLSPALTAPTPAPAVAQKVEGQKEVASPLTNVLAPATQPAVIFPPNGALTVPVAAVMLPPTGALTSPVAAGKVMRAIMPIGPTSPLAGNSA
ncbi:unnamed protein product, partial [Polarella glacialis]